MATTEVTEWSVHLFFARMRQEEGRTRYLHPRTDPRQVLAGDVESRVRAILMGLGYRVTRTGHNESWDLWCEGLRVEVKAARWRGRYQANLRGNAADVLVMGCINGATHFFVIPFAALDGCKALAIWSEDPERYLGKWAPFYEAWNVIDELAAHPPANPWQLPLF